MADYLPCIRYLLDRGIAVVRMGRRVLEPLPFRHPNLFDYSSSDQVGDELDVLLWAHASFAIGDSSGLTDAVALLGSPVFCPTYTLDPRAFLSNVNYSFATQRLFRPADGRYLGIGEVVALMNQGWNLGDEAALASNGLVSVHPTSEGIRDSVAWFVDVVVAQDVKALADAWALQRHMLEVLNREDCDQWRHYRRDALYRDSWPKMKSLMYPGSVLDLVDP